MEENRTNKTWHIEIRIWPETKNIFLSKLKEAGILECQSFTVWLVDQWAKAEVSGIKKVSYSLRILFSLMPMQVVSRGFKFGDSIFLKKHGSYDEMRFEWIRYLNTVAHNSLYQRITNAARCLIYAIILSPSELIKDLYNEFTLSKIGRLKFRSKKMTNVAIKENIYNALKDMYKSNPTTVLREVLDVLISGECELKKLIINNINNHPNCYYDKSSKTKISIFINNDLYRLKVFEFMSEHGIKTRAGLVYSLLEIALKMPEIMVRFREDPDNLDEDTYEQDMYEKMSINNYRYTGL